MSQDVRNHSLCGCRYTANPPFCDGQHSIPELDQEEYAEEYGVPIPPPPWVRAAERAAACNGSCTSSGEKDECSSKAVEGKEDEEGECADKDNTDRLDATND